MLKTSTDNKLLVKNLKIELQIQSTSCSELSIELRQLKDESSMVRHKLDETIEQLKNSEMSNNQLQEEVTNLVKCVDDAKMSFSVLKQNSISTIAEMNTNHLILKDELLSFQLKN